MLRRYSKLAMLVVGVAALGTPLGWAARPSQRPADARVDAAIRKGTAWLVRTQASDGSWGHYPAITALAATALMRAGYTEGNPNVARSLAFIVRHAKPNGAIYDRDLPNYNTAICLMALHRARNPRYATIIKKAQAFLARSQFDEGEGITRSDPKYGGFGYGQSENPDLSNMQHALEALRETGYPSKERVWRNALVFLQRCQNRSESNDQAWAGNDGGFIYSTAPESKAGGTRSYGSMTYAGLKSMIFCGLTKRDPRVSAAYNWLRSHYSVTENPGMGSQGLYYYYHTMAKALSVYGNRILTDTAGRRHDWAADLTHSLVALQHPEGYWVNRTARWWEDNKELVTAYTLLALETCTGRA